MDVFRPTPEWGPGDRSQKKLWLEKKRPRRKFMDFACFAYKLIRNILLFIQKFYFQKFFKDMIIQPWPIPTTTTRAMATITITCEKHQIILEIDIFGLENLIQNEKDQVLQQTYLYSNLSLH